MASHDDVVSLSCGSKNPQLKGTLPLAQNLEAISYGHGWANHSHISPPSLADLTKTIFEHRKPIETNRNQ